MLSRKDLSRSLAALHFRSIDSETFSKKLGQASLETFYTILLTEKFGKVFYRTAKDGTVIALCCVFFSYNAFNKKLSYALLRHIARQIITGQLSIVELLREVLKRKQYPLPEPIKDFHFGMIAREINAGPYSIKCLRDCCSEAFTFMASQGVQAMWACTEARNTASVQFLSKIGFSEHQSIDGDILFIRTI